MIDLKGKAAIVTGRAPVSDGPPQSCCPRRRQGRRRRSSQGGTGFLVGEIADQGGSALAVAGDVSDEAFAKELVERAEESYGHLDVAFNNAGILGEKGPTTGISLEGWNEALKVNLTSAFLAAKHQIPAMLKQGKGSIIFTSTFCRLHRWFPQCRGLCGEQIRADRSDAGPRRGIRAAEHPGQRDPSRRRRDGHV